DRVKDDGTSWALLPDATPVRTVAQLEALAARAGQEFKLSDAGTLTRGALKVAIDDRVRDDGTSWSKVTGAPALATRTVAALQALPAAAGQSFELTDAGTLTRGALSVAAGDRVRDDGTSWSKIEQADLARLKGFPKATGAVFRA